MVEIVTWVLWMWVCLSWFSTSLLVKWKCSRSKSASALPKQEPIIEERAIVCTAWKHILHHSHLRYKESLCAQMGFSQANVCPALVFVQKIKIFCYVLWKNRQCYIIPFYQRNIWGDRTHHIRGTHVRPQRRYKALCQTHLGSALYQANPIG